MVYNEESQLPNPTECKSSKKQEDIVYHYCSLETFIKIIDSRTIRLTDITKSNDSAECRWIRSVLRDGFKLSKEYLNAYTINNQLEKFEKDFPVYALCCSKHGDQLSQWRGYADDGCGISIGFDQKILEKINSTVGPQNELPAIGFKAVNYVDNIKEVLNKLGYSTEYLSKEELSRFMYASQDIRTIFKNKGFCEEKEYRLYVRKLNDNILASEIQQNPHFPSEQLRIIYDNVNYYASRDKIVTYINLELLNPNELIKKIYIGPKAKVMRYDVEAVLKNAGVSVSIHDILTSSTTYQ